MIGKLIKGLSDATSPVRQWARLIIIFLGLCLIGFFAWKYFSAIDTATTSQIASVKKDAIIEKVEDNLAIYSAGQGVVSNLVKEKEKEVRAIKQATEKTRDDLQNKEALIMAEAEQDVATVIISKITPQPKTASKAVVAASTPVVETKEAALSRARITAIWENFCNFTPLDAECKKQP